MATRKTQQVYRLSDLEVEEVSLVDRPANKRRFLAIKRSDMPKVKTDGRGNHSVAKSGDDAGEKTLAQKLADLTERAKKGEISHEELEALAKEAREADAAAADDADGAGEAGDAGDGKATQKRGRLSRARRRKLRQVVETLDQLLREVEPEAAGGEAGQTKGAGKGDKAPAAKGKTRTGKQRTSKSEGADGDATSEVTALRGEVSELKKQLAAVRKGAPDRNSVSVEDVEPNVEEEGWPLDMNAPVTKRSTDKSRSFFS